MTEDRRALYAATAAQFKASWRSRPGSRLDMRSASAFSAADTKRGMFSSSHRRSMGRSSSATMASNACICGCGASPAAPVRASASGGPKIELVRIPSAPSAARGPSWPPGVAPLTVREPSSGAVGGATASGPWRTGGSGTNSTFTISALDPKKGAKGPRATPRRDDFASAGARRLRLRRRRRACRLRGGRRPRLLAQKPQRVLLPLRRLGNGGAPRLPRPTPPPCEPPAQRRQARRQQQPEAVRLLVHAR